MKTIKLNCNCCGELFEKNIHFYNQSIKRGYVNFFCSKKCSSLYRVNLLKKEGEIQRNKNQTVYGKNPKLCLNCKITIPYEKRFNKYCSSSCMAKHTQQFGGNRKCNEDDKKQISLRMKMFYLNNPKQKTVKVKKCRSCGSVILKKYKQICDVCLLQYYEFYRPLCEFKFKLEDYPDKFDLSLLKKIGRYSPKNKGNNLNGVSRDHLYSVKDGFKNGVDPEIIKHPANCKLVIHKENQNKYTKSDITLEELKNRIFDWD